MLLLAQPGSPARRAEWVQVQVARVVTVVITQALVLASFRGRLEPTSASVLAMHTRALLRAPAVEAVWWPQRPAFGPFRPQRLAALFTVLTSVRVAQAVALAAPVVRRASLLTQAQALARWSLVLWLVPVSPSV